MASALVGEIRYDPFDVLRALMHNTEAAASKIGIAAALLLRMQVTSKRSRMNHLEMADLYLRAGDLAAADMYCRMFLDVEPRDSAALNIIGVIAAQLGMHDRARHYFEVSLECHPNYVAAARNLERLLAKIDYIGSHEIAHDEGPRFILIKAWGFGLWSDVSHVLGGLLIGELTGRTPVVHWGYNSRFSDGSGTDAFSHYFQPVSNVTIDDLSALSESDFFPRKWNKQNLLGEDLAKYGGDGSRLSGLHLLNRPEKIVVTDYYTGIPEIAAWIDEGHPLHGKSSQDLFRYIISRYLLPKPSVTDFAQSFFRSNIGDSQAVAVHVRGSDKAFEVRGLDAINRRYWDALSNFDPRYKVLLITDDGRYAFNFKQMLGDRLVLTPSTRSNDEIGIHHKPGFDQVRLGFEIATDTYLAVMASKFIGNGKSNVSSFVSMLKDWDASDCLMLAPPIICERNAVDYLTGHQIGAGRLRISEPPGGSLDNPSYPTTDATLAAEDAWAWSPHRTSGPSKKKNNFAASESIFARAPALITYAQNFEDVMLARLFSARTNGFYVDVGAADPTYLSVTKWFYDLGWSGINIEPNVTFHHALIRERGRDINLNCGAGAVSTELTYQETDFKELSSFDPRVHQAIQQQGQTTLPRKVAIVPLTAILDEFGGGRSIDFIKIDVEGWEAQVLAGLDLTKYRPTIFVIEAVFWPNGRDSHQEWENLLTEHGYEFVYFDGLNRFYLKKESIQLKEHFSRPPSLSEISKTHRNLLDEQKIACLQQQNAQLRACLSSVESHALPDERIAVFNEHSGSQIEEPHVQIPPHLKQSELVRGLIAQNSGYVAQIDHLTAAQADLTERLARSNSENVKRLDLIDWLNAECQKRLDVIHSLQASCERLKPREHGGKKGRLDRRLHRKIWTVVRNLLRS